MVEPSDIDVRLTELAEAGRGRAVLPDAGEIRRRGVRLRRRRQVAAAGGGLALATALVVSLLGPTPSPDGRGTAPATRPPVVSSPAPTVLLSADGLDGATFGQPADEVIRQLTGVLGPSTEDSGWQPVVSAFVGCPGTNARTVSWAGLTLYFSDGPTGYAAAPRRHLFYWELVTPAPAGARVATTTGAQPGIDLAGLRRRYPGQVRVEPGTAGEPVRFQVGPEEQPAFSGTASADRSDAQILSLAAGEPCGE